MKVGPNFKSWDRSSELGYRLERCVTSDEQFLVKAQAREHESSPKLQKLNKDLACNESGLTALRSVLPHDVESMSLPLTAISGKDVFRAEKISADTLEKLRRYSSLPPDEKQSVKNELMFNKNTGLCSVTTMEDIAHHYMNAKIEKDFPALMAGHAVKPTYCAMVKVTIDKKRPARGWALTENFELPQLRFHQNRKGTESHELQLAPLTHFEPLSIDFKKLVSGRESVDITMNASAP